MRLPIIITLLSLALFSCELTTPDAPAENEILDGHLEDLTAEQRRTFLKGDVAFGEIFTSETGLGPIFVGNSCASCHAGDGKGTQFVQFTRFGQSDTTGNPFIGKGGPQLQHKAIPGYQPESLPLGVPQTVLIAPAVTGLGFLDAVSDQDLIDMEDPNDLDGDGVSGRVHWNTIPEFVTQRPNSVSNNGRYITRFGKKGAAYDLLQQSVGAYNEDMGISSTYEPIDPYSHLPVDPEVSENTINDLVFYLKTLKTPIPREEADNEFGKELFSQVKCNSCHTPTLTTGESTIDALANKTFHPYTDLLLHDMGPGLDDGYTEGKALTSEWKTPALWGLGLSKDAQGGNYILLHDGRASSIEQAILLHGGEAENSKQAYSQLSSSEKTALIQFLESL